MTNLKVSILFAATLIISGCTVHHYHHHDGPKFKKKVMKSHGGHHGSSAQGLPAGHPPVKGMKKGHHGMKGHGTKGYHGANGHECMKGHGTKGHPDMKGHPDKKGHPGVNGHGTKGHPRMKGHGMKGSSEAGAGAHEGHKHGAGHDNKNLPPEVVAFHDSFASAWHLENDSARREAACAKIAELKKLAQAVKKLQGGVVLAAASKDLHKKTMAVASSCARKKGDVQAALVVAHDALHMLTKVSATPAKK